MAFGDVGGPITVMVVTCKSKDNGTVAIQKGDAVKLTGPFEVDAVEEADGPLFGQAMADMDAHGQALPVKVRGVCAFQYAGQAPEVDGESGVVLAAEAGKVTKPVTGTGHGVALRVDTARQRVFVLL